MMFRVRMNVVGPSRKVRMRLNRIVDGATATRIVSLCLMTREPQLADLAALREIRKAEQELAAGKFKTIEQVFPKKKKRAK